MRKEEVPAVSGTAINASIMMAPRLHETTTRPDESAGRGKSGGNVFRREGEYWSITHDGATIRMRDTKGMHTLARLLSRPGEILSSAELVATESGKSEGHYDPEKARVTVTKRIRSTVARIRRHHPSLGHHLSTCIKTGASCSYSPNPADIVRWAL
jgi:hypothetical protein